MDLHFNWYFILTSSSSDYNLTPKISYVFVELSTTSRVCERNAIMVWPRLKYFGMVPFVGLYFFKTKFATCSSAVSETLLDYSIIFKVSGAAFAVHKRRTAKNLASHACVGGYKKLWRILLFFLLFFSRRVRFTHATRALHCHWRKIRDYPQTTDTKNK